MRDIIVYVLIVLVYKVESRTFCGDQRCVCSNKENGLQISCSSHSNVLNANYRLPNTVRILDLSRNNLTRLEQSPSLDSETLKELLLANNLIKEISIDAFSLPSLERLDLSHNQLEYIHRDTFASIKYLEYLNLANNRFSVYGNLDFYHLKKLQSIVLDNNDIGPSLGNNYLFEGGYELTSEILSISLNNVKLSDNKKRFAIHKIDIPFDLKNLSLAQNNITKIIALYPNFAYLDLSNNPIKEIPAEVFYDSMYLRELKLNNILIEEVPDFAFNFLRQLRHLELEGNTRLNNFSSLAWGKDQTNLSLESITLRGANFTSLDPQIEGIFKKVKRVDLRDNPWKCDCALSWLQHIQIPTELVEVRCSTPQHLFNRRILDLNPAEFACGKVTSPSRDYEKTCINVAVYCTLLVITVLMMYFFIFSPRPFMYRQLPVEFPRTP